MTTTVTPPQRRKFHALCGAVARQHPFIPWRHTIARKAWKRFLIDCFVRELRLEAYNAGAPDPFPVRPVPSSALDARQFGELIDWLEAWCAQHDIELSK